MTLDEAYAITLKMTSLDDRNPSAIQREAKLVIYSKVIKPKFNGKEVPPHLEPDYMEGWEDLKMPNSQY